MAVCGQQRFLRKALDIYAGNAVEVNGDSVTDHNLTICSRPLVRSWAGHLVANPLCVLVQEAFGLALRHMKEMGKQAYFEIAPGVPPPTPLPSTTSLLAINCLRARGVNKHLLGQGLDVLIE